MPDISGTTGKSGIYLARRVRLYCILTEMMHLVLTHTVDANDWIQSQHYQLDRLIRIRTVFSRIRIASRRKKIMCNYFL